MKKAKTVNILRWKLYSGFPDWSCANTCDSGDRDRVSIENALLLREMDETNSWARVGLQLYCLGFTLHFIINAVALRWIFTYNGPLPQFANLVFLVFMGWNLVGIIATAMVYKSLINGDRRIKHAISTMARREQIDEESWSNRSPLPRLAIRIVFAVCGVTIFISLAFWLILYIT